MHSILLKMIYILSVHELNSDTVLYHQTWYEFPYDLWLTAVQCILAVNVMRPGAVKWIFSPFQKAGCQDNPLEKYMEMQWAPHASCFLGDPLRRCKLPAFQLMQIYLEKKVVFSSEMLLSFFCRPPPPPPPPPPLSPWQSINTDKTQPSPASFFLLIDFLLAEWGCLASLFWGLVQFIRGEKHFLESLFFFGYILPPLGLHIDLSCCFVRSAGTRRQSAATPLSRYSTFARL